FLDRNPANSKYRNPFLLPLDKTDKPRPGFPRPAQSARAQSPPQSLTALGRARRCADIPVVCTDVAPRRIPRSCRSSRLAHRALGRAQRGFFVRHRSGEEKNPASRLPRAAKFQRENYWTPIAELRLEALQRKISQDLAASIRADVEDYSQP